MLLLFPSLAQEDQDIGGGGSMLPPQAFFLLTACVEESEESLRIENHVTNLALGGVTGRLRLPYIIHSMQISSAPQGYTRMMQVITRTL